MRDPKNILNDLACIHLMCREQQCSIKCSNLADCKMDHKLKELQLALDTAERLIPSYLWREHFS